MPIGQSIRIQLHFNLALKRISRQGHESISMKKSLFYHEKNHKKTLVGIGINIAIATIMYLGVEYWAQQNSELEALRYWFEIGYFSVLILLVLFALYFFITKKTFSISVDRQYFEVKEPLFEQYNWKLNVSDIVEIDQQTDSQTDYPVIFVILSDGSKYQLTINHQYDMESLYDALKVANKDIKLPTPYKFRVPGLSKSK